MKKILSVLLVAILLTLGLFTVPVSAASENGFEYTVNYYNGNGSDAAGAHPCKSCTRLLCS